MAFLVWLQYNYGYERINITIQIGTRQLGWTTRKLYLE